MNLVKVFNSEGKHVDSFRKVQKKRAYSHDQARKFNFLMRILKAKGFTTRRMQ
jgi:hypothetical protein